MRLAALYEQAISVTLVSGYRDEDRAAQIQDAMIETEIRLERSFRARIQGCAGHQTAWSGVNAAYRAKRHSPARLA
ncbi:MAG TPA: hypothetical protein VEX67_01305 [Solirubrobacteraceae bacterium]|nr:hypothetical protein [Solirubrobacteraceae bacterium]